MSAVTCSITPSFPVAILAFGLGVFLPSGGHAQPPGAAKPGHEPDRGMPVRVLVAVGQVGQRVVVERLKKLKFQVRVMPIQQLDPDRLELVDVIFLPTQWAEQMPDYNHLEAKKKAFHAFVKRGGGLLVCQPNPPAAQDSVCTPGLLPYPITFKNWYDATDPRRKNFGPEHFITRGLPDGDMPFPADPIVEIDRRYTILARQISTGSPSLAVCAFDDGRVVVQTANENYGADIPLSDEILRRMIVWAAGREGERDPPEGKGR